MEQQKISSAITRKSDREKEEEKCRRMEYVMPAPVGSFLSYPPPPRHPQYQRSYTHNGYANPDVPGRSTDIFILIFLARGGGGAFIVVTNP